jgi:naphthalene 1,2-dioxygenase ferredoxin reductase component
MTHRLTITDWPEPIEVFAGETILEAILRAGVPMSHGCRSGTCGACKARLVRGDVDLASHSVYALTARDRAEDLVLTCRAYPRGDGTITRLGADEVAAHPLRRLECAVSDIEPLTEKIRRVRLRVVKGGRFTFSAGQFASVTFAGQPARDFSMANRPSDRLLEFHIRRVAGGASSVHATTDLAVGDIARVDGPYGACWLRESHGGPIIAVAEGSGLAPMKSIVETALAKGMTQSIQLYVTAPSESDLYMLDHFRGLEQRFGNFTFAPVLEKSATMARRRDGAPRDNVVMNGGKRNGVNTHVEQQFGLLRDLVTLNGRDFKEAKIYSAGSPRMVDALTRIMLAQGVPSGNIHAEPFHVAPADTMEKKGAD